MVNTALHKPSFMPRSLFRNISQVEWSKANIGRIQKLVEEKLQMINLATVNIKILCKPLNEVTVGLCDQVSDLWRW